MLWLLFSCGPCEPTPWSEIVYRNETDNASTMDRITLQEDIDNGSIDGRYWRQANNVLIAAEFDANLLTMLPDGRLLAGITNHTHIDTIPSFNLALIDPESDEIYAAELMCLLEDMSERYAGEGWAVALSETHATPFTLDLPPR